MREFPQSVPYGADQTIYLVVEGSGHMASPGKPSGPTSRRSLPIFCPDNLATQSR